MHKKVADHKTKVDKFWLDRTLIPHARVATHFKDDNAHIYDLEFIKKFTHSRTTLLDLGCGNCYLTNLIEPYVQSITAVDKQASFLKLCKRSDHFETICSDLIDYVPQRTYDLIMAFGVFCFFDYDESVTIIKKVLQGMRENSVFLIKHACGVNDDVIVDGYSEKIGSTYFAFYKGIEKETAFLKRFFPYVRVTDIYPKELNPWSNTHYYAFECRLEA